MLFGEINPSKKYRVKGATLAWMIRQCKKVANMRGDGVTNKPDTITIAWPPRGKGGGTAPPPLVRARVVEVIDENVALVKRWDGTSEQGDSFAVRIFAVRAAEDEVFVARVLAPHADITYNSELVGWIDIGGSGGASAEGIDIQITGYSTIPDVTNRWSYSWTEVEPDELGAWVTKPGGLTSAGSGFIAYNSVEANNSATGMQGNSTTAEEATLRPIQGNPVVFARWRTDCNDATFLSFQLANASTGGCTPA